MPEVIEWHRRGLVPLGPTLTADPRCRLVAGDFFALAAGAGLDPETLAHAFVAADKALRKKGLRFDAAQVPEFLAFAYKERLEFPPGNDKAILAAYDRTVLAELERGRFNDRQADRSADSSDSEKDAQTAANRKKTGGGRK